MEKEALIQLVQQAQQSDANAISTLFAQYKDVVYSIAMRETKNRALSDDIVQETFVEVILKINDLKNPASFFSWLKILAYHQCTRYYKKKETVHETAAIENDEGWTVFDTAEESNAYSPFFCGLFDRQILHVHRSFRGLIFLISCRGATAMEAATNLPEFYTETQRNSRKQRKK